VGGNSGSLRIRGGRRMALQRMDGLQALSVRELRKGGLRGESSQRMVGLGNLPRGLAKKREFPQDEAGEVDRRHATML